MNKISAGLSKDDTPLLERNFLDHIRPEARFAADSGIVEAFNYGRGREGLIPLWVGEGDLPTPEFIREAAIASLHKGETFYTHQRGEPDLRRAIAAYMARTYDRDFSPEQFFVTGSGMHALQLAVRLIAGSQDEILVPTPAWPNFEGALGVSGASTVAVPMRYGADGWVLETDDLAAAISPRTKAIVINSPSNPTGWTASADQLRDILAIARQHDLWIISDEIYGRFVYYSKRAPSFQDIINTNDKILFVQSLSKNWAMTGWRAGWLQAPPSLGQKIENLIQYSVSGVPVFVQRAATAALDLGDDFIEFQRGRTAQTRQLLCSELNATGRVRCLPPDGAFYLFFKVDGVSDARRACLDIIDEAGVGLAPGTAFGKGGESFFRLCFARHPDHVNEAAKRLSNWISQRKL